MNTYTHTHIYIYIYHTQRESEGERARDLHLHRSISTNKDVYIHISRSMFLHTTRPRSVPKKPTRVAAPLPRAKPPTAYDSAASAAGLRSAMKLR